MQKGWAVGSSRQAPSSKPSVPTTRSASGVAHRGRTTHGGTTRRPPGRCARARSTRAAVSRTPRAPRWSSSRAHRRRGAPYRANPQARSIRCSGASSSTLARRYGRNEAKSSFCRASTQAWCPLAAARVISTRSSVGTRQPSPVAARDPDQARIVGVVGKRLLQRSEPLEQAPDLGIGEAVVDDASKGRERVGARLGSERRQRHALLPAEHPCSPAQV